MRAAFFLGLLITMPAWGNAQPFDAAIDLYYHGNFQDSTDMLSNLNRQEPNNAELYMWLGKGYLKLRRWDAAVKSLEKAVRIEPDNGGYHLWLGRAYGHKATHVFFLSAYALARQVGREFETAVRLLPESLEARFDLLEFYTQAPGLAGGDDDKAEAQAEEISRISPSAGYKARAALYEESKKWDLARKELIEGTRKFPESPNVFIDLAEFLVVRGDYEAAEATARKLVTLVGKLPAASMLLAASQIRLKRNLPEALKVLQDLAVGPLTDYDPAFETVYYWLGEAHVAVGDEVQARKAFETSLRFDPYHCESQKALKRIR